MACTSSLLNNIPACSVSETHIEPGLIFDGFRYRSTRKWADKNSEYLFGAYIKIPQFGSIGKYPVEVTIDFERIHNRPKGFPLKKSKE